MESSKKTKKTKNNKSSSKKDTKKKERSSSRLKKPKKSKDRSKSSRSKTDRSNIKTSKVKKEKNDKKKKGKEEKSSKRALSRSSKLKENKKSKSDSRSKTKKSKDKKSKEKKSDRESGLDKIQRKIGETKLTSFKDEIRFTIVVIGDIGVGKTQIINRCVNQNFTEEYSPTIQVDFQTLKIEQKFTFTHLNFYDVSGHEEFQEERRFYYAKADAVLVVYDATLLQTYQNLVSWIKEAKYYTKPTCTYSIVENKADLQQQRVLSSEEGLMIANLAQGQFYSISAKEDTKVQEMIDQVLEKLFYQNIELSEDDDEGEKEKDDN